MAALLEHVRAWTSGKTTNSDQESSEKPAQVSQGWPSLIIGIFSALFCLYVFLVGLQLLGDSFKCLGGRGAGGMFEAVSNPVAGLMIGILATVLVQSSSTSTSIVVGLVGAEMIDVQTGIPIVMGANIGTSVTNIIVSMGQCGESVTLQRAFSGAIVHDMFNMLTVATLLPLEMIIHGIQGEGGPLYWITKAFTDVAMSSGEKSDNPLKDKSPTKIITSPVAKAVISNNKYIINALSLGAPAALIPASVNETACAPLAGRRLHAIEGVGDDMARSLLSRRMASGDALDCSRFYCVPKDLDTNFEKIDEDEYETLTKCDGLIGADDLAKCKDSCYLNAGAYYTTHVDDRRIIKGGFTEGLGDIGGGVVALLVALLLLGLGLIGLCKVLKFLFMGTAKRALVKAANMNDYVAIIIGMIMTIIVQSSSVTTSALTPLCGIGVLPLRKMLPMTLGANIGTTTTALIASLASFTHGAVHIALCHLFFNIFGILIWYPLPFMRQVPLGAATLAGLYASNWRFFPVAYILVMFVAAPGALLGLSAMYDASIAGGVVLTIVLAIALGVFEFWWIRLGGCYKVLSTEVRQKRQEALDQANKEFAETSAGSKAVAAEGEGAGAEAAQRNSETEV